MSAPDWTADLALYPDRPPCIDVVALLSDPHFDGAWRGDLLAGAEVVAALIEQQKRDAVLVDVLLSYLNDNLTEREKGRLGAELMNRDLSDHRERRIAALARATGAQL